MPLFPGHIHLVAVGKLQTGHWQAAQETYRQRLHRYTDFTLVEIRDAVGRGQPDAVALQKEGAALLQAAGPARRLIALTPAGQQTSSEGLARFLQTQLALYDHLAFLVGGPLGFSPEVLAAAHFQLALSPLTFPHELARVILLEQLYRAFTILNHEPYHK